MCCVTSSGQGDVGGGDGPERARGPGLVPEPESQGKLADIQEAKYNTTRVQLSLTLPQWRITQVPLLKFCNAANFQH